MTFTPLWGLPFAGLLCSVALGPLAVPRFWHHHCGKIAAGWALAFLLPCTVVWGTGMTGHALVEVLLTEYVPFILRLTALYTVAGGIYIRGNPHGSPAINSVMLLAGSLLSSVMGTVGASMLLIRPLIRANDNRKRAAHVIVFFIFIVCNISGSLTPLANSPLFLGFLHGVPFSWTFQHLLPQTALLMAVLLVIFYFLDHYYFYKDGVINPDPTPDTPGFGFEGAVNFWLIAAVVALILTSGIWHSSVVWHVAGVPVGLPGLVRDVGLAVVTLISILITPRAVRHKNRFNWAPMREVAELFAGIFLTIIPVIVMLQAGATGPLGMVVRAVTDDHGAPIPAFYFWITGALSSVLNNAPTYLVFFHAAGGNAGYLTTAIPTTLAAISAGSVFMGATTYIGNAPNLMVKVIAQHHGIRMPGFLGYLAWSGALVLPLLIVITVVFYRG